MKNTKPKLEPLLPSAGALAVAAAANLEEEKTTEKILNEKLSNRDGVQRNNTSFTTFSDQLKGKPIDV